MVLVLQIQDIKRLGEKNDTLGMRGGLELAPEDEKSIYQELLERYTNHQ